jgi:hypothetical protein
VASSAAGALLSVLLNTASHDLSCPSPIRFTSSDDTTTILTPGECKKLKGADKKACKKEAKAKEAAAMADLKAAK